jgi:hypothetical protein
MASRTFQLAILKRSAKQRTTYEQFVKLEGHIDVENTLAVVSQIMIFLTILSIVFNFIF